MTSKISFFKLMKANIRHRGWLAALNAVLLFLFLPAYSLMTIDSMKAQPMYTSEGIADYNYIAERFPGMLSGYSNYSLIIFVLIAAILCGITGFTYLHSREKQDFYHGMPVKRSQWFAVSYTTGLLIFIIPYLLFGMVTLVIVQFSGLLSGTVFIQSLIALLGGVLNFIICYHAAIFAMFLTGRIITGVLASCVLLTYGTIVSTLSSGLADSFFATRDYRGMELFPTIWRYLSPTYLCTRITQITSSGSGQIPIYYSDKATITTIACTALLSILFIALAFYLYKHYPAEAVENALSFPKSAPVIKILIVVPIALFIGLLVQSFRYNNGVRWLIITGVLASVLLCLLIEFIYHRDLTKLCKGKISSAISIGLVVIVFCTLQFDLIGYDSYLPDKAKLDKISFYTNSFQSYFSYPEDYLLSSLREIGPSPVEMKDYDSIYKLAEDGIANLEQNITPQAVNDSNFPTHVNVSLTYQLKSEKNVYRTYAIEQTQALDTLSTLCENEEYRKDLFPLFHIDTEKIHKIKIQDIYHQTEPLGLTMDQQNTLIDAYKKDLLSVDIKTLQYESPVSELYLTLPYTPTDSGVDAHSGTPTEMDLSQFYIYSTYTNTLRTLEEYGYTPRTQIETDDVLSMFYYPNIDSGDDNNATTTDIDYKSGNGIQITDPQEIKTMLTNIRFNGSPGILSDNQNTITGSVEITLTGSSHPITYPVTQ